MKTFWECVPLEHDAKVRRFSELRNYSQLFSRKTPVLLTQVKWVAAHTPQNKPISDKELRSVTYRAMLLTLQNYAPYVTELCSVACRAMLRYP